MIDFNMIDFSDNRKPRHTCPSCGTLNFVEIRLERKKIYDEKTNMVCYETTEYCKITCSKCGHTWSEINYY
jgi:predicted nucleic-acid-binding Zn-ribbon protein